MKGEELTDTEVTYTNDIKTEALFYVSLKLPVIPLCSATHQNMTVEHRSNCKSPGKAPVIPQWNKHTLTTNEHIYSWLRDLPSMNIGLPLGENSGIVGIDIDGEQGEIIFNSMSGGDVPKTWEFTTGHGRRLLYRLPDGLKTKKMTVAGKGKHEEFSILCTGQQTVIPPSVHSSGRVYKWKFGCGPKDIEIASAPQWIIDQIKIDETKQQVLSPPVTQQDWINKFPEGQRDVEVTRKAGSLLGKGLPKDLVIATMITWNRMNCQPPLEDNDVIDIVERISFEEEQKQAKSARMDGRSTDKKVFRPTPFAKQYIIKQKDMGYVWKYSAEMGSFFRCDVNDNGPWQFIDLDFVKSEVRKIMLDEAHGGNRIWDSSHYVNEALDAIRSELILPGEQNIFDLGYCVHNKNLKYNPLNIICLKNGLFDWSTNMLSVWTPDVYTTIKLPVEYNPEAKCPHWELALRQWIADDNTISFLQEFIGLCLIPDTSFRTAVMLYGTGANGKSMFLDTIRLIFGNSLVSIPLHRLTNRFETAYLQNKLINICGDIDAKYMSETGVIKTIIGGDLNGLRGEIKHGKSFDFTPICRLMFSANVLPKVSDKSIGWISRWKFIEFPHMFDVNPAYKIQYSQIFESEKSGILNWAIKGLQRLKLENKWTESQSMKKSEEDYRNENDNVVAFMGDYVEKVPYLGGDTLVSIPALYRCYNEWLNRFMTGSSEVSQMEFTRRIANMGYQKAIRKIDNRSTNSFLGIRVRDTYSNAYKYWLRFNSSQQEF